MPKRTTKLLTLELELERLAEFSAAAEVFGARSKSTFLNQYVVQKIREAKATVTPQEFEELVEKHKESIEKRSSEIKERSAKKAKSDLAIKATLKTDPKIERNMKPQTIKSKKPVAEGLNFSGKVRKVTDKRQALLDEISEGMEKEEKLKKKK